MKGTPSSDVALREPISPPARLVGGGLTIQSRWAVLLLCAGTFGLLSVIFPPANGWPLAYICLVPWLVAVTSARRRAWMFFTSYLMGLAFWIFNAFWLSPITPPGWIALSMYLAAYFPLVAWVVRYMIDHRRGSVALVLPFAWVGTEWLRARVITGFPWFFLGHSQHPVLTMIQISDLVGAYGVSFVVAVVNGWIVDMMIQPILVWRNDSVRRPRRVPVATAFFACVLVFTILYGRAQLAGESLRPGPKVAVVQEDYPITVSGTDDARPWDMLAGHLKLSLEVSPNEPDLLVWPESAASATLNRQFLSRETLVHLLTEEPNVVNRLYLSIGQYRHASTGLISAQRLRTLLDGDAEEAVRLRRALARWHLGKPMERWAAERLAGLDRKRRLAAGLYFDQWDHGHLTDDVLGLLAQGRIEAIREPMRTIDRMWRANLTPTLALEGRPDRPPAWIVAGGYGLTFDPDPPPPRSKLDRYNNAYVYDPDGRQVQPPYSKIHCVLFGEYVPFRYGPLHWLYVWLNSITPWGSTGFEYSLTAGDEFVVYTMTARSQNGRPYRFGVPICYENVMPEICRRFVQGPDGRKRVDFLLNISNDGWFEHAAELPQHFVASVFRAVENRVGVGRAVNTGISGFVDPTGRVYDQVTDGERLYGPGIVGSSVSTIFTDTRHSLYTRWGDWFSDACAVLLALMVVDAAVVGRLLARRRRSV